MTNNQYGQPVGEPLVEWQPAQWPSAETLNGRFCQLVPLDPQRDYGGLFHAYHQAADGRDWTYLSVERPNSPAAMLQHLNTLQANPTLVNFTVFDRSTGAPVGTVAFMRIDENHGVLEIGHVSWSPAMKQHSCASEAIFMMLRYAFVQLGYRRCEWKCDSHNMPSRQAALRFGFIYEGRFKFAIVTKGRSRDTDWFAITVDRWPMIECAFEQWLAAENFSHDGQQKKRLQAFFN